MQLHYEAKNGRFNEGESELQGTLWSGGSKDLIVEREGAKSHLFITINSDLDLSDSAVSVSLLGLPDLPVPEVTSYVLLMLVYSTLETTGASASFARQRCESLCKWLCQCDRPSRRILPVAAVPPRFPVRSDSAPSWNCHWELNFSLFNHLGAALLFGKQRFLQRELQ